MAKFLTYLNPLDPLSKYTKEVECSTAKELIDYVQYDSLNYDVVVSKNNEIIDDWCEELHDGDIVGIVVIPKGGNTGKTILRIVAVIALTVAFGPQAGVWGATLSTTEAVASAAIIAVGTMTINAVLAPSVPDSQSSSDTSNTYGWDTSSNLVAQGSPLPILFGTMKVTPPLISKYVETIDDKQYLNLLFALADCTKFGALSSVSDIEINDVVIGNYDGVSSEIRYGNATQDVISKFDDTFYDVSINQTYDYQNNNDWDYSETNGDRASSLKLVFSFPYGLYKVDNDGKDAGEEERATWQIYAQYSTDQLTWFDFPQSGVEVEGKTQTPFFRTFQVSGLSENKYYVRWRCYYSTGDSGSKHPSKVVVQYLQEGISDNFTYPGTALLAVRALATDQLSGSLPTVKCTISNGLNNPADCAIALLNAYGVESASLITDKFNTWRTNCNSYGYTFNAYIDFETDVSEILKYIGNCGRARIEQFGSRFGVIEDVAGLLPAQGFMFTMGNILKDSFKESFLPIADRANVLEISFIDSSNDYEKTIVEVSSETYDSVYNEHRKSINLIGCTSRAMAIKHGKYLLNCNRYLTLTASWEADVDSLVCRVGDIVQVSHDVPQWGQSGRIESCSTTQVVLDRPITMEAGKAYNLRVKRDVDNSILDIAIVNSATTTDTLSFVNALSEPLSKYEVYSFGEISTQVRYMRVIRITTSGNDMRRTIGAIEYNESVYNDSATITPTQLPEYGLRNLTASDYIRYAEDRSIRVMLYLSWNGSSMKYTVGLKYETDPAYTYYNVYDNYFILPANEGAYSIVVRDQFGNELSKNYTVLGKLAPPDPVTDISVTTGFDTAKVSWVYNNPPIDIAGFKIEVSPNGYDWQQVATVDKQIRHCNVPYVTSSTTHVRVYAVDTSNVSSELTEIIFTPSIDSVDNVASVYSEGKALISWTYDKAIRGIQFEVRKGSTIENSILHSVGSETKVIADTNSQYLIRALYVTDTGVRVYSSTVRSIIVDESALVANVISTYDDSSIGWDGIKDSNVIVYLSNLSLKTENGIVEPYGRYITANPITLSSVQVCRCSVDLTFTAISEGTPWDAVVDFDSWLNVDGTVFQGYSIVPMISLSQDGVAWSDFVKFYPGDYVAKAFKFAVDLYSENGSSRPIVSSFKYTVDMQDRVEKGASYVSSTSGLTVSYNSQFQTVPNVQITILDAQQGDDWKFSSGPSVTGFSGAVWNNGVKVARNINHISQGY